MPSRETAQISRLPPASSSEPISVMRFLIGESWILLIGSVVTGIACGIASVVLLAMINRMVTGKLATGASFTQVFYIALVLLVTGTKYLSLSLLARLIQAAVYHLRSRVAEALVSAPLRAIEEAGTAKIFGTLTEDVMAVANGLIVTPFILVNASIVIGCWVYIYWLSWHMALMLVLALVILVGGYAIPAYFAVKMLKHARAEQDRMMELFHGMVEGNKELKLNRDRRRLHLAEDFQNTAIGIRDINTRGMEIFAGAVSWGQSLPFVLIAVALFGFGAGGLDASKLTVLIILFLTGPLEALCLQTPSIARTRIALQRLQEITRHLTSTRDVADSEPAVPATWNHIEMRGVKYTYSAPDSDSRFSVGPIDLTLKPGQLVFVVGGNGSGKSTFIKLLAGLYAPEEGEICWDHQPVDPASRDDFRGLFAAVFSDYYLFRRLPVTGELAVEKARYYLERLQLSQKVDIRDGSFSTIDLSQGQRQRLAMVAAYLENRPIYLFDEWAASQDPVYRRVFYRELLPEFKAHGKTAIVISHDEEFYDVADRIVRFHDGRIQSDQFTTES